MSIYSFENSFFDGETSEPQIGNASLTDIPGLTYNLSTGDNIDASGDTLPDTMIAPKINIFTLDSQGGPYYLQDAGQIQFFTHDKPIEFYGDQACLVRNRHIPGTYVIRVPSNTAVYRIADFREMFESRQTIGARNAEYVINGPYVNEREVGINCGLSEPVPTVPVAPSTEFSQSSPRSAAHPPAMSNRHIGEKSYYCVPSTASEFAVYPDLVNRVQSYLDATISGVDSSVAGSDSYSVDGGTTGSSICPGSASELFAQRYSSRFENLMEREYRADHDDGYAFHGGYGQAFSSRDDARGPRNFTSPRYEHDGPLLDGGHGQHESYAPTSPTRPNNDGPSCLPPRHLNKKTNALYKTEMCRNWNEIGECRYGRSCQFAHGKKELRTVPRHGQWKTKTCMAWLHGGCTYGSRCCYAHELIDDNNNPQSPNLTDPDTSTHLGEIGDSRFSEFFASRFWA